MDVPYSGFGKMELDLPCVGCEMDPQPDGTPGDRYCEKCCGLGKRFKCAICNKACDPDVEDRCTCEWRSR